MAGLHRNLDAVITPISPATAEAALACVRRCCPEEVADLIAAMLGIDQ